MDNPKKRTTVTLSEILGVEELPPFARLSRGDVVEKKSSTPGDLHPEGHRATVVGSAYSDGALALAYYVIWEGETEVCVVGANRLALVPGATGIVPVTAELPELPELPDLLQRPKVDTD